MLFKNIHKTGREKSSHDFILLTNQILLRFYISLEALTRGFLISFLPTIVIGCSSNVLPSVKSSVTKNGVLSKTVKASTSLSAYGSTLDILVFDDDPLMRLDSFQRVEKFSGTTVHPTSTGGGKIFFLYYGSRCDRYAWAATGSYGDLRKMSMNLEDETRSSPVMTGQCRCEAGETHAFADLVPLACRIKIISLKRDFSDTPYAESKISDIMVYLTDVNACCSIAGNDRHDNIRLINAGMLNPHDMQRFEDRSLVCQSIEGKLADKAIKPDICLWCYPAGTHTGRPTRLVIEGKIDGRTYYWPFTIGTDGEIIRNRTYSYNITLKRKGVSSPDIEIEPQCMNIDLSIKPWIEKEDYPVRF